MKKVSVATFVSLLAIILFSCSAENDNVVEACYFELSTKELCPIEFEIITKTYSFPVYSPYDAINISYPQIRGLGNDSRENTINEMIENHIFEAVPIERNPSNYYPEDVIDITVVYHIATMSAHLLSIVYEYESRFFTGGRDSESWRNARNAFAITIDIETATRLQLSDFTPTDLPEEAPGFDIYNRIIQSRELFFFDSGLKNQSVKDSYFSNEELLSNHIKSGVPFGSAEPYDFFVMQDALYYISSTTVAGGSYLFVKILDEAEPFELPQG